MKNRLILGEEFRKWVYRHLGIPGLVVLLFIGVVATFVWNWDNVKKITCRFFPRGNGATAGRFRMPILADIRSLWPIWKTMTSTNKNSL